MRSIVAIVILVPVVIGGAMVASQVPGAPQPTSLPFQVQVVTDFESPWAMTFLPDGRMLVTEKAGALYLVSADGQQRKQVAGMPAVASEGQGGLLDVVLHPGFTNNRFVYFSYSEAGQGGKGVVLARGALVDGEQPAMEKVEALKDKKAFAIPSPARRTNKGWALDPVPLLPGKNADAGSRQAAE